MHDPLVMVVHIGPPPPPSPFDQTSLMDDPLKIHKKLRIAIPKMAIGYCVTDNITVEL